MGKCGSCGYSHPHPGEKSCRFSKDAQEKCREAGVEETRWKEFLDVDTLQEIAKSEGHIDSSQFVSLRDFNIMKQAELDRKAQMDKMEHDMSRLADQMTNLLSSIPSHAVTPATGIAPAPLVPTPVSAIPVTLPVTTTPVTGVHTTVTGSVAGVGSPTTMVTAVSTSVTGAIGGWLPASTVTAPITGGYAIPTTTHWRSPVVPMTSVSPGWGFTPSHVAPISSPGVFAPTPGMMSGYSHPIASPYHYTAPSMGHVTPPPPMPSGGGAIPASYLSSPLTPVLQHLADLDPRQTGMIYRPDYHVLHCEEGEPIKQVSHKNMSYRKLVHGMVLVARHIRKNGGDLDRYLAHMDYVTRHGKNADYMDSAYVEYDKMIIDDLVREPSSGLKVGDVMASSFCFHDVTRYHKSNNQPSIPSKKKKKSKIRQGDQVPDDYPPENCFFWNYRTCVSPNCNRNHVCRICGENHRAMACSHRKQ